MPQFTASLTTEGLELLVMIGLCSSDMKQLQAASAPVPRPPVVTGIIDTGSNCCCISARVAGLLGTVPIAQTTTQTAGGTVACTGHATLFLSRTPMAILQPFNADWQVPIQANATGYSSPYRST